MIADVRARSREEQSPHPQSSNHFFRFLYISPQPLPLSVLKDPEDQEAEEARAFGCNVATPCRVGVPYASP